MIKKIIEDKMFTNKVLDKIVLVGESSGVSFKSFCKKNGRVLYTIFSLILLVPVFFVWSFINVKTP